MSSIYRNARLTIVTASAMSTHDDVQQRQISQTLREIPWTFSSNPNLISVYLVDTWEEPPRHNIVLDVENSRWKSRAWTFQERFLSKRVLYLGKQEAYWECLDGKLSETLLGNISKISRNHSTDSVESRFNLYLFGNGRSDK